MRRQSAESLNRMPGCHRAGLRVRLALARLGRSAAALSVAVFFHANADPAPQTYSTNFPIAEDPISEGGHWLDTRSVSLDWSNIAVTPGLAAPSAKNDTAIRYNDPTAVLTGSWEPDQSAEGKVAVVDVHGAPEVEIRLRTALAAHRATGYEIAYSVAGGSNGSYLIIVRWNGALADFTYLARYNGPQFAVKAGDVIKATMVGNVITACKNGVVVGKATDDTFATGNPGFGLNEGADGTYGFSSFKAWNSPGGKD